MNGPGGGKASAVDVAFEGRVTIFSLADGRRVFTPLERFPFLVAASEEERNNWRIVDNGTRVVWPDIGQEISLSDLMGPDQ